MPWQPKNSVAGGNLLFFNFKYATHVANLKYNIYIILFFCEKWSVAIATTKPGVSKENL